MKDSNLFFLDSGAFTVKSKGLELPIQDYIDFIKAYDFELYANLDVIGKAGATMKNQKIMEAAGLTPIPTYHVGEDLKYLKHYLANYEYISIGGLVGMSSSDLIKELKKVFDLICDNKGRPKVKVHGFGITGFRLIKKFPWYSLDSNSPVMAAANGRIYLPKIIRGKFNHAAGRTFSVSDQGVHQTGTIGSYVGLPKQYKDRFQILFGELGFELGKIQNQPKRPTRKQRKEKEASQTQSIPLFSIVEEPEEDAGQTLANDWKERVRWNLHFWKFLENELPQYEFSNGEKFRTTLFSVTAATTILDVVKTLDPPPKILTSYAYLSPSETFINQIIEYKNQK